MQLNKIIQRDYTSFSLYYQIKLPLDLEISIPSDDPVRLVSAFVEEKMCIRDSTRGFWRYFPGVQGSDRAVCEEAVGGDEAVSYTHLDVYKRQFQDRPGSPEYGKQARQLR